MSAQTMECQRCGVQAPRRGPVQKYCVPCSDARNQERNKRAVAQRKSAKSAIIARGMETSKANKTSLTWADQEGPCLDWVVRVAVPFMYAASKNHIYAINAKGHVALRQEAKAYRAALALTLQSRLRKIKIGHKKLWIDIFVEKSSHQGDAVNVIDLVCDAIQDATGLNDRWYCIRRLDWSVSKHEPRLIVGIGQESGPDVQICSYCGRALSFDKFNKHKGNPLGIGRECKECRSAVESATRQTEKRSLTVRWSDAVEGPTVKVRAGG